MLHQVDTAHDDFYPRPPRGGRLVTALRKALADLFLSTPSARRATPDRCQQQASLLRISIHALREEGDRGVPPFEAGVQISIHALREEGDGTSSPRPSAHSNFYPRPPRGGRPERSGCGQTCHRFLSTPSARRATLHTGRRWRPA